MDLTTTSAALTVGACGAVFCATPSSHPTRSAANNSTPRSQMKVTPVFLPTHYFYSDIGDRRARRGGNATPLPLSGLA
jgi:hypothetical protein